jgi:hypothetical protein
MVLISEWLPNPKGTDAKNEWVELSNTGSSLVDLTGWRLTADGKKFFTLQGAIGPQGRIVLPRTQSKIALKNTDGKLALYDVTGRLADQVSFVGNAPENESANRAGSNSFFGKPTPGAPNVSAGSNAIAYNSAYPFGVPIGPKVATVSQFAGFLLGTALALAAAVMFILKSHEDLSRFFFDRNQDAGSSGRRKSLV